MDYDDIDYDEGYSMRDIDNSWLNDNMNYETDSDSDIDDYNYNYNNNTNNWNSLIRDKINRMADRHSNSFLDRINKKLESLEAIERSTIVERKNDRKDNWHDRKNNSLVSTDRFINGSRKNDRGLKVTERPIVITYKDNKKDFDERKDYSHVVQKMIEVEKVRSSIEKMQEKDDIERQENNNRKDGIVMERTTHIETIQKNPSAIIQNKKLDIIDEDKEKGMER